MNNPQLEAEVWQLKEELKQLREDFNELQKEQKRENKTYTDDFREILIKRKELHEEFSVLAQWKQWIDDFIEKVKKILPIK